MLVATSQKCSDADLLKRVRTIIIFGYFAGLHYRTIWCQTRACCQYDLVSLTCFHLFDDTTNNHLSWWLSGISSNSF